jgi:hypothetical protein
MEGYKRIFPELKKYIFKQYGMTDNPILKEAVLSPLYLEEVHNYLFQIKKDIQKQKFTSLSALCLYLSIKMRKYQVRFKIDEDSEDIKQRDEFKAGITKSGCLNNRKGTINIYVNENLIKIQNKINDSFFDFFIKNVVRIIGHELIHRHQGFVIANEKLKRYIMDHSQLDGIKYLSNPQEMMSRAWQILEEFRYNGQSENQIKHLLSNIEKAYKYSSTLIEYFTIFDYDKKENKEMFKQLQKYIYQYYDGQEVK